MTAQTSTVTYSDRQDGIHGLRIWEGMWSDIPPMVHAGMTFVLEPANGQAEQMKQRVPQDFSFDTIHPRIGDFYIADRDFHVPESRIIVTPEPFSGAFRDTYPSPKSQALYHASRRTEDRALLIQELICSEGQAFGHTSCHHHLNQSEIWIAIRGSFSVVTRPLEQQDDWHIHQISAESPNNSNSVVVDPGVVHQLRTTSDALVYLFLDRCPRHDDSYADHHFNYPPPDKL